MSKFKVGDKVIYDGKIATIFGVADKANYWGEKYAISYQYEDDNLSNRIVKEEDLQLAEIEVGDIVNYIFHKRCKVLEIKNEKDMDNKNVLLKLFYGDGWRYRMANIDNLELVEKGGN